MRQVDVVEFMALAATLPVLDVRSPGEYAEGHISGAINLALFTDAERALVGTLYKQRGRQEAVAKGLELVGPKMAELAQRALQMAHAGKLLLHCWRGGMRSNSLAWLFEQTGLECAVLLGGYKAFRGHLLSEFSKADNLMVLDGPTGCGKTEILGHLLQLGHQTIDLEALASHRGSAFGDLGMGQQPTTQQFQNELFHQFSLCDVQQPMLVEGESLTIGKVYLPHQFWQSMNKARIVRINMAIELRAQRLVKDYGAIPPELLAKGIKRITDQFGGNRVKQALQLLDQGNLQAVAELLLVYYDERYNYGQARYRISPWLRVELESADAATNALLIHNAIRNA